MLKHQFSDFSYAVNTDSAKKGYKEILVCYIYNGVEVLRKVYIPEGPGISYIFEARKIIDKEIKDGTLSSYSYRFIRRNKKRRIKPRKLVAAINEGKSLAAAEGFTGFAYAVKPSANLHKKFVEVSYNYNGEKVIRTLKLRGKATDDYVTKAKDKIKDEIDSGFLEKYSEKYLKEKALLNSTPTRTPVVHTGVSQNIFAAACVVVALVIAGTATGLYFALRGNGGPSPEPEPEPILDYVYGKYEKIGDQKARAIGLDIEEEQLPLVRNIFIDEKVTIDGVECEVTEIKEGALAGCSTLETVTLPFIGGYYDIADCGFGPDDDRDTDHLYDYGQLFGYVFGKNIYDGVGKLTWQSFYKNSSGDEADYRITKAAIPFSLRKAIITRGNKPVDGMAIVPQGAFSECKRLSYIDLQQSGAQTNDILHYHIEDYAFANCAALEKVNSPDGAFAVNVDGHALENCRILESFVLNGCKEIGDYTFANCDGIQGINVPSSIEKIGEYAFTGVQSPTIACEPTRDEVNEKIASGHWKSSWIDDTAMIVYGFVDSKVYTDGEYQYIKVKIDQSTTGACLIDFTGDDRKDEYIFPGTLGGLPLVEIAAETYYGYSKLEKIDFTNCTELRLIGNYCFLSCKNLKTIKGLKNTKVDMIGAYAFDRCGALTIDDAEENKTFPSTLKTIGKFAFANCAPDVSKGEVEGKLDINLEGTQITHMGEKIFANSTILKQFISPDPLDDIGNGIFQGCVNIESLTLHTRIVDKIPDDMFSGCEKLKSVIIDTVPVEEGGMTIKNIGNGAFRGCTALETVVVDMSTQLATIGDEAFKGCVKLDDISTDYWDISMLEKIGDSAFEDCVHISKIDWADSARGSITLREIGKAAFKNCCTGASATDTGIQTVVINSSALETIGDEAFYGNKRMTSFKTNNLENTNFKKIGASAFSGCSNLQVIFDTREITAQGETKTHSVIPTCVEEVGDYAFEGCTSINYFAIPWNSTKYSDPRTSYIKFGAQTFKGWTDSQRIRIEGDVDILDTDSGKGWIYRRHASDNSRFTRWAWNMSLNTLGSGNYCCSAADSEMQVVINLYKTY